jgi:hypothetical protein
VIERMLALLDDRALNDRDRANLHFALGKAFDDLAAYEAAIGTSTRRTGSRPSGSGGSDGPLTGGSTLPGLRNCSRPSPRIILHVTRRSGRTANSRC